MNFFKKKVSLLVFIIGISASIVIAFTLPGNKVKVVKVDSKIYCPDKMDQLRLKDYQYVRPLILTDIPEENASFHNIRDAVNTIVNQVKAKGNIEDVSVYFRSLNNGAWFSINPKATFNPGTLKKIVYLIVYLKEADNNNVGLDKKIFSKGHSEGKDNQDKVKTVLKENAQYSISELLKYMIEYSDNDAMLLLEKNLNRKVYDKLFEDLQISASLDGNESLISVRDFCKFFRILYSSSYFSSNDLSEYGMKLLTNSGFKDGLLKGVEGGEKVAHQFGEYNTSSKFQSHEFGVVFMTDGQPYLIGIMSKGNDSKELMNLIAEISKKTYVEYKRFLAEKV